jgi:hypothetical protein
VARRKGATLRAGRLGKAHVWAGFSQPKVSEVLDALREGRLPLDESEESWERLWADVGSKGPRLYDWIRLPLNPPMQEGFSRWLLVRRQIDDPEELTAYVAFTTEQNTTLEELAKVAGSRWKIEEAFDEAKYEVGLDHYEVRSWVGWHRHITLAMFAHVFLCAIRASGYEVEPSQKGGAPLESKASSSPQEFKKRRGL